MGLIVSHLVKQRHVNLDTNFKTCDVKFVSILEEITELLIFTQISIEIDLKYLKPTDWTVLQYFLALK